LKERAKELLSRGRRILEDEKWKDQFSDVWEQFKVLIDSIRNDSTTNQFTDQLKKLGYDLAFNEKGYPDLFVMEDSLIQIKNMLIPLFTEQLGKMNIAKIEFSNEKYDAQISDISLSGSFLPEHIDFRMRNESHLDTKNTTKDYMKHILQFQVDNIKPEFHNFKFYYRRKVFPKITDYGVADAKITGSGALIRVNWRIDAKSGSPPKATLSEITCYIDKLELHIVGEKTKHELLDAFLAPFYARTIKEKIAEGIEDFLREKLNLANEKVNEFLQSRPLEKLQEKENAFIQEQYKKSLESVNAV